MMILPLIVNGLVIAVIGAELIAISLGIVGADELLVVSGISALLTIASFKLSKDVRGIVDARRDSGGGKDAPGD